MVATNTGTNAVESAVRSVAERLGLNVRVQRNVNDRSWQIIGSLKLPKNETGFSLSERLLEDSGPNVVAVTMTEGLERVASVLRSHLIGDLLSRGDISAPHMLDKEGGRKLETALLEAFIHLLVRDAALLEKLPAIIRAHVGDQGCERLGVKLIESVERLGK